MQITLFPLSHFACNYMQVESKQKNTAQHQLNVENQFKNLGIV